MNRRRDRGSPVGNGGRLLAVLLAVAGTCLPASGAATPPDEMAAVNQALAKAAPGDTIVVKNGLYRDASIELPADGSEGKPVTLAAETPGKVWLTGRSRITLAGKHQHVTGFVFHRNIAGTALEFRQARHCRLSHTAFNESGDVKSVFTHMVEVGPGSTDNRIDHCYLARSLSMSIGTRASALRLRIDYNWFRDIVSRSSNGQEAVQLLSLTPIDAPEHSLFATVERNLFDGACGDEEIISVKSSDNVIRFNTFRGHPTHNKGELVVRHGHRNLIDSNYFFGTVSGIRVSGTQNRIVNNYIEPVKTGIRMTAGGPEDWAYAAARDCLVANNTVAGAKQSALEIGTFMGMTKAESPGKAVNIHPAGNRFHNNILTGQVPQTVVVGQGGKLEGNDFQNNLVACSAPGRADGGDLMKAAGLVQAPSTLLSKEGGRFRPGDAGLVVDRGVPVDGLAKDIEGRPRKDKPDIGCDELDAGEGAQKPLTGKDVGPDWMKGDWACLEKDAGIEELKDLIRRYPDAEFRQRLKSVLDAPAP